MLKARKSLIFGLFLFLGIYVIYQARFIVFGPRISVTTPLDNEVLSGPLVSVSGVASDAAYLTLNGGAIFTDPQGRFAEKLLVATGTSIIELKARDHFGRVKLVDIRVTLP